MQSSGECTEICSIHETPLQYTVIKGAPKLYFIHYPPVAIILLNNLSLIRSWVYISLHSLTIFGHSRGSHLCMLWFSAFLYLSFFVFLFYFWIKRLKVGLIFIYFNESALKMMKNAFYFMFKTLSFSRYLHFCPDFLLI